MKSSAIVHPQIQALIRECENLRLQLSRLLEEQAMLEEHTRPYLEAIYLEALGHLEFRLLQAQADNSRLRRRLELSRAIVNRGERLTDAERSQIDIQLEQEWREWKQCLAAEERRLKEAEIRLATPFLSEIALHTLKTLYRKAVRLIHPDATGFETPAYRKYWNEVQQAYRRSDIAYLEILYDILSRRAVPAVEAETSRIEETEREHQRLTRLLKTQVERLARIRSAPPYRYETHLQDPDWICGKQAELKAAIHREEETHRRLLNALNELSRHIHPGQPALH